MDKKEITIKIETCCVISRKTTIQEGRHRSFLYRELLKIHILWPNWIQYYLSSRVWGGNCVNICSLLSAIQLKATQKDIMHTGSSEQLSLNNNVINNDYLAIIFINTLKTVSVTVLSNFSVVAHLLPKINQRGR